MSEANLIIKAKRTWHSLTVWVNGVAAAVFALLAAMDFVGITAQISTMQQFLSPKVYNAAMVTMGVLNILIRVFKTKAPIGKG